MITVNNKKLCENCFKETTIDPCPHCGFSKSSYRQDPITLGIGSILNQRYMIGRVIGKGGFGITYLAYDVKLDTRIAIKEYYPMGMAIRTPGSTLVSVSNEQSEEPFKNGAEKFYNEAKMVAKFNGNPNVVSVHDFFYENDTVYFTMGYLEGETLKSYLRQKKLSEGQAVKVWQDISNALMASHSMNILHRDISPDNIMLCNDGSIKLLDFGAARQVMAEQSQSLSVILKQGFAPLEQYQKKGRQGPWTDIYALGATIYHSLTGDSLDDPMTRLEDDSALEGNKHGISDELWNIIHKSLMLKIDDRYQDVFELKKDLNALTIKPESIYDVKEEEYAMPVGHMAKAFGSTEEDPNATVLLSGQENASAGDETMALSPDEAAAYTGASESGATEDAHTGTTQNGPEHTDPQMPGQPPFAAAVPAQSGIQASGASPAGQSEVYFDGQVVRQGVPQAGQPGIQPVTPQMGAQGAGKSGVGGAYQGAVPVPGSKAAGKGGKKGLNPLIIIIPAALAALILVFVVIKVISSVVRKGSLTGGDDIDITEQGSNEYTGNGNSAELTDTYENDEYAYSIGYNADLYSLSDYDSNPVELINEDGTHHIAVMYLDEYDDGIIIYDVPDYINRVEANNDLLLPSENYSNLIVSDTGTDVNSEGETWYEYRCTCEDDAGRVWRMNVSLVEGEGEYGIYAIYQMILDSAKNADALEEAGDAVRDAFKVTGSYDPGEFSLYYSDEYGIRFSTQTDSEASILDDGSIYVTFNPGGDESTVGIIPGDAYGDTYEEMFEGVGEDIYTDLQLDSKMYPIDRGLYDGYMVTTRFSDSGTDYFGLFMALTAESSDTEYKTYILGVDDAEKSVDYLTEIADGFRFDGAPAQDLSDVDADKGVSLSRKAGE